MSVLSSQMEYSILEGRDSVFSLSVSRSRQRYTWYDSIDRKIIQPKAVGKCHIPGQLGPSQLHKSVPQKSKTEAVLSRLAGEARPEA